MSRIFATILTLTCFSALTSCDGNQIPADDLRREPNASPPPPFRGEIPHLMEFVQGELKPYSVSAYVPEPGTPLLTFENMPEGSTFEDGVFSWQPPCELTEQMKVKGYHAHQMRWTLRSTDDPDSLIQQIVVITVARHDANPDNEDEDNPCAK